MVLAINTPRFPAEMDSRTNLPPGLRLRQARERLGLTFRDVECSSYDLASVRGNRNFIIHVSRLAAIENQDVIPSPHKVCSLAYIYRIDPVDIFNWYGVPLEHSFDDGSDLVAPRTHLAAPPQSLRLPGKFDPAFDPHRTDLLSRMVEAWKDLERVLFKKNDRHLYGYVGLDDHMMEPMVPSGSLVLIDPMKRKVKVSGWRNDFERPIYFVDFRDGYTCSWCVQRSKMLILQPHSLSPCTPKFLRFPDECSIVGQVIGLIRRLDGL